MEWIIGTGLFLIITIVCVLHLLLRKRSRSGEAVPHGSRSQVDARGSPSVHTTPGLQGRYRFGGEAVPQFHIVYSGDDGALSERNIFVKGWSRRRGLTYYTAWCFLRDEERVFRSDRIIEATLENGRTITDIAAYLGSGSRVPPSRTETVE